MAFCQDGRVPELYEPGLRVVCGTAQTFAQPRVAVGGAYVDDFLVSTLPAKAMVVRQEAAKWRLEAVALDLGLEAGDGWKEQLSRGRGAEVEAAQGRDVAIIV